MNYFISDSSLTGGIGHFICARKTHGENKSACVHTCSAYLLLSCHFLMVLPNESELQLMSKKRLLKLTNRTNVTVSGHKVGIFFKSQPKFLMTGCSFVTFDQTMFLCDFGHFTLRQKRKRPKKERKKTVCLCIPLREGCLLSSLTHTLTHTPWPA